ncbi:MAG: GTPase, partial [Patescibacteria group bacterium]|nr:GTPase [Patescibacteria group bacterium]
MTPCLDDTIAAIASAPSGAARGIVRLSGPAAVACACKVFRAELQLAPEIRLSVASEGTALPDGWHTPAPATLLVWPEGRSYTGQPMAEVHTFGSPPLLEALLRTLCRCGARLAGPGEFTMRAFLAGRLDLAQAEAVLGVIEAERPEQLDAALSQLAGGLSGPLGALRNELVDLLAHVEASFEFVEEDIETLPRDQVAARLANAGSDLRRLLRRMEQRGESARAAAVLIGLPNAGKSSLFNALT